MSKLLVRLQSKPHHIRVMIMWLAVFICMIIVFGVWLWSFNRSIKVATEESKKETQEAIVPLKELKELKEEVPSLWQSLGAGIKSLFEGIGQETLEEEKPEQEELEVEQLEVDEIKPVRLPEIE